MKMIYFFNEKKKVKNKKNRTNGMEWNGRKEGRKLIIINLEIFI